MADCAAAGLLRDTLRAGTALRASCIVEVIAAIVFVGWQKEALIGCVSATIGEDGAAILLQARVQRRREARVSLLRFLTRIEASCSQSRVAAILALRSWMRIA